MDEFENIEQRSGDTEAMLTAFEDEAEYSTKEVNDLTSDEISTYTASNTAENTISSDEIESGSNSVQPMDEQAIIDKYKSLATENSEVSMKQVMETILLHKAEFVGHHKGWSYQHAPLEITETAKTKFFICLEMIVPLLYWYNPFHGMITGSVSFLCPVGLASGLILVALWRTRCSNPVIHILLFNPKIKECHLVTQKVTSYYKFDLKLEFNALDILQ
jgi:hypothetical protein